MMIDERVLVVVVLGALLVYCLVLLLTMKD